MKQLFFDFPCDLPDIPFSVEQEYVTLQDLESGRYISSPVSFGEFDDFSDDTEDDYDDICLGTIELDDEFDRAIYEEKNPIVTKVDEVKEERVIQEEKNPIVTKVDEVKEVEDEK